MKINTVVFSLVLVLTGSTQVLAQQAADPSFDAVYHETDPPLDAVYRAAHAGHVDQARQMMAQVLRDHPQSGRAHFVEAELLLQQGQIAPARAQLAEAERIAPTLPFASPDVAQRLRTALSPGQERIATQAQPGNGSLFRSVLLAIGAGAVVAWFLMRLGRRQ